MKGKNVVSLNIDTRPVRAIDSLLSKKGAYKKAIVDNFEDFAVYAECDLSKDIRDLLCIRNDDLYVVAIDTENQVFFIYSSSGFEKVGQGKFESSVSSVSKG